MSKIQMLKEEEPLTNETKPEVKTMNNRVNLLDVATAETMESPLELVRLGIDETAIIPFTADSEGVDLHYCSETEINGYVVCNGPDCVLCRIGRRKEQRLLLPVYLPAEGRVGILPVSRSLRPFALLPQIANALKTENPMVMFVSRDGARYTVLSAELKDDVDRGEASIKNFLADYKADHHALSSIYPKIENEQLACVEEIGRMMALKGIGGIGQNDVN